MTDFYDTSDAATRLPNNEGKNAVEPEPIGSNLDVIRRFNKGDAVRLHLFNESDGVGWVWNLDTGKDVVRADSAYTIGFAEGRASWPTKLDAVLAAAREVLEIQKLMPLGMEQRPSVAVARAMQDALDRLSAVLNGSPLPEQRNRVTTSRESQKETPQESNGEVR